MPPLSFLPLAPSLTLQVLQGERHDSPCSGGSHQALDVGRGQGKHQALLSTEVSACVERDEDGLVHAWRRPGHHATHCVGQLLGHQERLEKATTDTQTFTIIGQMNKNGGISFKRINICVASNFISGRHLKSARFGKLHLKSLFFPKF